MYKKIPIHYASKKNNPLHIANNITKYLGNLKANHLAKCSGAVKRKPRKISATDILRSYWLIQLQGEFSYDNWASQISCLIKKSVSKQAVFKRIDDKYITFLKELLNKSFKMKFDNLLESKLFDTFLNVYVQDATHFSLPNSLSNTYPGSFSRSGKSATAKIQATFNLKKGIFSKFNLKSFRDSDAKDDFTSKKLIKKGDLVIRDLGYYKIKSFKEIIKKKADFLSRWRYKTYLNDIEKNVEIDLVKYLKKNGSMDKIVELGKKDKIICRIVAIPLSDKIKNERIRRAKNNRNKRVSYSKEYYFLLGYSIYITSVKKEIWTSQNISQAYRSRWYIEILFKSWKSSLHMKNNIPERYINKQRAEFFFYASLIFVNLIVMPMFLIATHKAKEKNRYVSIIKLSTFIKQQFYLILTTKKIDTLIYNSMKFILYEKRLKRLNALESMMS